MIRSLRCRVGGNLWADHRSHAVVSLFSSPATSPYYRAYARAGISVFFRSSSSAPFSLLFTSPQRSASFLLLYRYQRSWSLFSRNRVIGDMPVPSRRRRCGRWLRRAFPRRAGAALGPSAADGDRAATSSQSGSGKERAMFATERVLCGVCAGLRGAVREPPRLFSSEERASKRCAACVLQWRRLRQLWSCRRSDG